MVRRAAFAVDCKELLLTNSFSDQSRRPLYAAKVEEQ
jgi:hypothetical protein